MPSQTPEQTPMKRERRMRAYYYGFSETGVDEVDDILEQVAIAGKMYHHTDSWCDSDEDNRSCIDMIQDAALEAAKKIDTLRSRCESLEKALKACMDYIPGSEVRSWPPGYALRKEALRLGLAALSQTEVGHE